MPIMFLAMAMLPSKGPNEKTSSTPLGLGTLGTKGVRLVVRKWLRLWLTKYSPFNGSKNLLTFLIRIIGSFFKIHTHIFLMCMIEVAMMDAHFIFRNNAVSWIDALTVTTNAVTVALTTFLNW